MGTGGDYLAYGALMGNHRHPGLESGIGARIDNQRARKPGRVAADDLGRDRIKPELVAGRVLQSEQRGKALVFRPELPRLAPLGVELDDLVFERLILPLDADQADVAVKELNRAVHQARDAELDGPQGLHHERLRSGRAIPWMGAGGEQMERQQQQRAAHQHDAIAPQKGAFHSPVIRLGVKLGYSRAGAPDQSTVTSRGSDSSSSTLPAPITTAVSGSSASVTGRPVSSRSSTSRLRSSAPPPASTIPLSTISEASSGGVRSSAIRTDSTTWRTGSINASRISS